MAARKDNAPKQFREVTCDRCATAFQSTGPNNKRCEPCRLDHKREYERLNKRASHARRAACERCGASFPTDIHAATIRCEPCVREERKDKSRARYASDLERHREYGRRHYRKHSEAILAARQTPDERAKIAIAIRKRRRADPGFRLHSNIARVINLALGSKKACASWQRLVGYTLADLTQHLERQFLPGMTWQNMNRKGWHVDHILPRSLFRFTSPDDPEFKACWALTNLRPLWAADNLRKTNQRIHLI